MIRRRISLRRLLAEIQPGSHDAPWSWADERADLLRLEPSRMAQLIDDMRRHGQRQPVLVGDDGRLWDGHHRVVAAMELGRSYVTCRHARDLTDDESFELLLESIDDAELAGRL